MREGIPGESRPLFWAWAAIQTLAGTRDESSANGDARVVGIEVNVAPATCEYLADSCGSGEQQVKDVEHEIAVASWARGPRCFPRGDCLMNEVEEVGAECSGVRVGLLDAARVRHGGLRDCAVVDGHIQHVAEHDTCPLRVCGSTWKFGQKTVDNRNGDLANTHQRKSRRHVLNQPGVFGGRC